MINSSYLTLGKIFTQAVQPQYSTALQIMKGPYEVVDITAYIFRPDYDETKLSLITMPDTGLAGRGDSGSEEVDFGQLDPNEMKKRALAWYNETLARNDFDPHKVGSVAVVYDNSRRGSVHFHSAETVKALSETLLNMSTPAPQRFTAWFKDKLSF